MLTPTGSLASAALVELQRLMRERPASEASSLLSRDPQLREPVVDSLARDIGRLLCGDA